MTVKIILLREEEAIAEVTMENDRLSIGRRAECDLPIKDPAVSGEHAEIEFVGNGYIIKDLGSTNGIHVKGRKVKMHALKDGDIVYIGEHQLKVSILDKSVDKKKANEYRQLGGDATTFRAAPAGSQADGYLKYVKGGEPGKTVQLEDALTTIGVPGVQVAAVSKRPNGHFIIHVDGGEDRNRTPVVNGEAIGFKSRKLAVGDLIEVADLQLEYCFD